MPAKEILLVTNYYLPERGAASNRMQTLARGLQSNGYKVTVVCPLPNYPQGSIFPAYKGKFFNSVEEDGIKVHRLWLWPSNSSNKFVRLLSMLSFSWSLQLFLLLKKTPKIIFIQYSPVFVGFTAILFSWFLGKKRILNVSDIWPLAGLEMGLLKKGFYYSILEQMERFCYKKAHLVVGQSQEILDHVKEYFPNKPNVLYRNVPNFTPLLVEQTALKKDIKLVYAGLLGVAQGLHAICKDLKLPSHITLHIYGAGPEAKLMERLKNDQIIFHGEVSREQLHGLLVTYDIAFIPLINRIYGSVPSKIFEYTRLGLPVLYYAGGEGEDLVTLNTLGWTIPANKNKLLQQFINELTVEKLQKFQKKEVQKNTIEAFSFETQMERLLGAIKKF